MNLDLRISPKSSFDPIIIDRQTVSFHQIEKYVD